MEKMDTLDLTAREQVLKIRVHGASVPPHRREVIGRRLGTFLTRTKSNGGAGDSLQD